MSDRVTPSAGDYIRVQGNKQYLPVANRVQWFRGEHPTWTISTSVVELDWTNGYAVLRAEVLDDTGRLIASGMKTETRKGFGDFVEKAETGAVGRALARTGYGTEDALDLEGDRYADAPIEQPERGTRGAKASSPSGTPAPAPVQRTPEEQELIGQLLEIPGMTIARASLLADAVGVPKGTNANADQLREMLARTLESPEDASAHATPAAGEDDAPPDSPASDTPPAGSSVTAAATAQVPDDEAVPPGTSSGPAPAPTDEDIERVTGGEIVWPRPGSPEYKALPSGAERAKARAYWDKQPEPEQETLAEALGAPKA
jgi:hypothetical protein